jgi:hypothetical protein
MKTRTVLKEWAKRRRYVPPLGERHTLCSWVRDEDGTLVDMQRYSELLSMVPSKIANSLERARAERAGVGPMLKAGLGYCELLSGVIVDGTAISSSATENILFPNLLLPSNYLAPGGIPGRTLRHTAYGRVTNIASTGTQVVAFGSATATATTVATAWAKTGTMTIEGTQVHTNALWKMEATTTVRSVGASGTVFSQGRFDSAARRFTSAVALDEDNMFMCSAGAATPATITVDTTVPEYLIFSSKWSLGTAYSIQGHLFTLEALN